jgi:hypothetical protein
VYQRTRESVLKQSKLAPHGTDSDAPTRFAFAVEKSKGVGFAEVTPEFPDMLQV